MSDEVKVLLWLGVVAAMGFGTVTLISATTKTFGAELASWILTPIFFWVAYSLYGKIRKERNK